MQLPRVLKYYYLQFIRNSGPRTYMGIAAATLFVLVLAVLPKFFQPDQEIPPPEFGELPDFASIQNVDTMKAAFFDYLRPIVEYHNKLIVEERSELLEIQQRFSSGEEIEAADKELIAQLAEKYDYELLPGWDLTIDQAEQPHPLHRVLGRLLLRVDEIPVSLALVQAAKESGWGRSRFAVEANNLFGQWCYAEGCGLVPERRTSGEVHEVARFDSVADAIGSYMNNLNSYHTYETLRLIRGGLRSADEEVTAELLADGLIYYSQRRQDYVDEIKVMIRQYHEFQEERLSQSSAL